MVDESFIAAAAPPCDTETSAAAASPLPDSPLPGTQDVQKDIAELKKAFADFMQHKQPEIDRMREDLRNTVRERDDHAAELQQLKNGSNLKRIAEDYSFNDAEYLEYVLQKNHISADDADAVKAFMLELKKNKPRFFNLPLKAGAGSRPGTDRGNALHSGGLKRMDALEVMISHAREIV